MKCAFDAMPTPKAGAVDKVRARRARFEGVALEAFDRQASEWAEHLDAEISEEEEAS